MSETKKIINEVSPLVEGFLHESGMEMVDLEFRFESGRWTLRIFIDKERGVTVDDCANVNKELGYLIEAKNIIDYHYVLEVSSPGLNRPLKKEKDFMRSIGKMIKLELARPVNKRSKFTGRLTNVREGMISLLVDNGSLVELPLKEIDKARVKYKFNN
ncbi:MAG: ribosome maturation factor RimP [Candidatus Omnitrophota bacterium]